MAVSDTILQDLQTQSAEALQRYNSAQLEFETFVGSNTLVQLTRQISITTGLLDEAVADTRDVYAQFLAQARILEATLQDAQTLRQQMAVGRTQDLAIV